uniref:FBA_2 domain-containing protein n=1 Tax=Steinernema glaseri TaxID=37863 RepID=A0A1I7ZE80_9BILA
MDAVPQIFVESVILCSDRKSILRNRQMSSRWGKISSATIKKIHTLQAFVDMTTEKLYAFAHPTLLESDDDTIRWQLDSVPLDSVDLKFITKFRIEAYWIVEDRSSPSTDIWKEISLSKLKRLCEFIKPTTEGIPPVYDIGYCNKLEIRDASIHKKLLSMRLPVDTVDLWIENVEFLPAVEAFLQNSGPLYSITIWCGNFTTSVDALIDKFVPMDGSIFSLHRNTRFTKEQLERLVLKCELSNKKVTLVVCPEGSTESSEVTDFFDFDFDKYYVKEDVEEGEFIATREGAELELRVESLFGGKFRWRWDAPGQKPLCY